MSGVIVSYVAGAWWNLRVGEEVDAGLCESASLLKDCRSFGDGALESISEALKDLEWDCNSIGCRRGWVSSFLRLGREYWFFLGHCVTWPCSWSVRHSFGWGTVYEVFLQAQGRNYGSFRVGAFPPGPKWGSR